MIRYFSSFGPLSYIDIPLNYFRIKEVLGIDLTCYEIYVIYMGIILYKSMLYCY